MRPLSNGTVTAPSGFTAGATACGIKESQALDLMVLYSARDCRAAGLFTKNQVVAASVVCNRETLASNNDRIRVVVANAGIANACTGELGLRNARDVQRIAGAALECAPEQVLGLSTGIIGVQLPMEKIDAGINSAARNLSSAAGADAAHAIMTTDTLPKQLAIGVPLPEGDVTIGGMAKGSGMIHPDMATMLAVITTDAAISAEVLHTQLVAAADRSFNRVSVDGDTSTSDTVLLLANGASGLAVEKASSVAAFGDALTQLCRKLAAMIVRDGEGVSRFVTVRVGGARTEADAHRIANTIATSPLVKTAFAGGDPNWGRIMMAAGRAGVPIDQHRIALWVGERDNAYLPLVAHGTPCDYDDADAERIFGQPEFSIHLDLGLGDAETTVWTGDLTRDYVTINSDYRT